ncbi:hypothetical protein KAR91_18175 [Candidatus Pacearchaeota archaeon]|nr:hypothetical protein [Candidatus Pacearchaeota archaeon]
MVVTAPGAPDVQVLPQMSAPSSLYNAPAPAPAAYESPYKGWEDWAWQTKGLGGVNMPSSAWNNAPGTAALAGKLAGGYQDWLKKEQTTFDKAQAPMQQPQQAAPMGGFMGAQAPVSGYQQPSYTAAPPTGTYTAQPTGVMPTGGLPVGAPLPMGGMTPGISTGAGPTINPYSLTSQTAGGQAAALAGGQGLANIGQAGAMRDAAGNILNTAFDPRQEVYDRSAQQLQDQVRVGQAARGTAMSPYGAGIENQAMSDFNIDWQNQQLQRQAVGAGAAGAASMQAGNLGQQGVGQVQAQGQMPWDAWNQQQQTDIQNWIAYMNMQNATTGQQIANYPNAVDAYGYSAGLMTPVSAIGGY